MRAWISLFVATAALWTWLQQTAEACSCVPPDYNRDYVNADHVLRVRAIASLGSARGQSTYLGLTIGAAYKGCLPARSLVVVRTASDGAACGYPLEAGVDYLLHAQAAGRVLGAPVLRVGLCNANSPWDDLPDEHAAYLESRSICCGDECSCRRDDEVQCFVDPCQVSRCEVEGAVCNANYCGGCNAEWTDPSGARVCLPESTGGSEEGL